MDSPFLWSLISLQVFMGAFDTLVHHEGSERLAWRPSQKTELRLHGVRNFFYAVIFLTIAWFEPHGLYTIILGGILAVEVVITLWDFVEEDITRKLPGTERINHTLLALNYGAILALAAPYLVAWSALPSSLTPVSYGMWSIMATASAIGVAIFSARDLFASGRSARLARGPAADLVAGLPPRQSFLITGGTGFIGVRLVQALVEAGHSVTVLTRDLRNADTLTHPVRLIANLDQIHRQDRFDAIINLAGEPVAGGLWTAKRRGQIIQSRVATTHALIALILRLDHKPKCLINGSAVGWYGNGGDAIVTETSKPNPAFTHDVCQAWETAAMAASDLGVRVVCLRIGLVLGTSGGMLAKLLTPFEFGGGGTLGKGDQWMAWIERDDLVRVIAFTLRTSDLNGPVNAVAPSPVRNTDFTKCLAAALHRPAILRFPSWLLTAFLGDMAHETMLTGQRATPARLTSLGFAFRYNKLAPMLCDITGAKRPVDQRPAAPVAAR